MPGPEPTSPSPRISPLLTPLNSTESSTRQGQLDHERIRAHSTNLPDNSIHPSESEAEDALNAGTSTLCQCPQAMVNLLQESETRYHRVEIRNMHIIIAQEKKALNQCNQLLDCNHCSLLSDHMMLAAVVLNKFAFNMEEVSRIYIQRQASRSDLDHQTNFWDLSIGAYAVDLEVEWAAVMKVLIVILLERALDMLECLKRIAKANLRETQISMLQATEQKAKKVALNMQSSEKADRRIQSTSQDE